MKLDICTIPINDVFEVKEGCPICRMRKMLEGRVAEYITGAAMMEPDIRIKTNELGFCHEHFISMLTNTKRLPVALILDSHLAEINKKVFGTPGFSFNKPSKSKQLYKISQILETCFICESIEKSMLGFFKTMFTQYESDKSFRELFAEQADLCLVHYSSLISEGQSYLSKKSYSDFQKSAQKIASNSLAVLHKDIKHFCSMYDYRSNGPDADWGNSKDSIERSIKWLTSKDK